MIILNAEVTAGHPLPGRTPLLTGMRDRMRAKGKAPKTILMAVARQLLTILNAMIRSGQPIRLS